MSLSDKQFEFSKDVLLLLNFALSRGWKFTLGEVMRTKDQQEIYYGSGRSQTMDSLHLLRLAIDINFFKPIIEDGIHYGYDYTVDKKDIQMFGDFWESLHKKNKWGGNFKTFTDTPHFQRNK